MSKTNMDQGFTATAGFPDVDIEEGAQLTRIPVIVAYFNLTFKDWAEEELGLSSDEIVATINGLELDGMDDEDKEQKVLDALKARKSGEVGEDVNPIMDAVSAQRVRADATNYGAKLPKVFSEHANVFLDAIDDIKLACLICLDDVAGRVFMNTDTDRNWKGGAWAKDDIIRMPVPGTKAPKGTIIDDGNRHQWDYYSYKAEDKTVINSSFFLDAAIATDVGSRIYDALEVLKAKTEPNDEDKKQKEILRKRLANVAKFLRDGVTVAKALIEFERFKGAVTYQVQREEDGSPQRGTPYPLRIWPQNAIGKAESFTLSNMKTMLKTNAKKDNVVDVALANGGTFASFKAAMPAKERKTEGAIKIATAKQFLMAMDVMSRFLPAGGVTLITKVLDDKETGQGALDDLGSFMTAIGPVWENYKADYAEMKAKEKIANRKVA